MTAQLGYILLCYTLHCQGHLTWCPCAWGLLWIQWINIVTDMNGTITPRAKLKLLLMDQMLCFLGLSRGRGSTFPWVGYKTIDNVPACTTFITGLFIIIIIIISSTLDLCFQAPFGLLLQFQLYQCHQWYMLQYQAHHISPCNQVAVKDLLRAWDK